MLPPLKTNKMRCPFTRFRRSHQAPLIQTDEETGETTEVVALEERLEFGECYLDKCPAYYKKPGGGHGCTQVQNGMPPMGMDDE